jgi:hypothetical protein
MKRAVTFLQVKNAGDRLHRAQCHLGESILFWNCCPLPYPAGRRLTLIGDVLAAARRQCEDAVFVWCNSDVVLTRDPFDVPDPAKVYGFYRREVPSGEVTHGVDMYYIPVNWWDDYLSRDIPELYLGASYVDWWISRAMEKAHGYENLTGYIDHISHEKSAAAADDADPHYQHNFREYNRWARRNGLDPIPAPPYLLPAIGHVWGVRNALSRIRSRAK